MHDWKEPEIVMLGQVHEGPSDVFVSQPEARPPGAVTSNLIIEYNGTKTQTFVCEGALLSCPSIFCHLDPMHIVL